MRPTISPEVTPEALAKQQAEFLARGGKVQQCGAGGYKDPNPHAYETHRQRALKARKR
jgi:hypothetical protein